MTNNKNSRLQPQQILSTALNSLMAGALAFILSKQVTIANHFEDFVSGATVWENKTKSQDLIVIPLVVLFIFLSIIISTKFFRYVQYSLI